MFFTNVNVHREEKSRLLKGMDKEMFKFLRFLTKQDLFPKMLDEQYNVEAESEQIKMHRIQAVSIKIRIAVLVLNFVRKS